MIKKKKKKKDTLSDTLSLLLNPRIYFFLNHLKILQITCLCLPSCAFAHLNTNLRALYCCCVNVNNEKDGVCIWMDLDKLEVILKGAPVTAHKFTVVLL